MKPIVRAALIALIALTLGACGAMRSQNPRTALSPVNAVAVAEDASVMLKGADVVAYFTENRYVQGQANNKSIYEGVTFHFASAANKALFDRDPRKYLPEYGGYCANGISYGIPWGGDGMGRYRGHIELVDEPAPSIVARLRDGASRLETPIGTALVLWICSLPLIAVLAILAFDATAAIAAAAAALIALVAGCVWAFGRSAEPT